MSSILLRASAALTVALLLSLPGALYAAQATGNGSVECSAPHLRMHNPNIAKITGTPVCFQAYISNFNTGSVDAGDGKKLHFATPHWVIQKVEETATLREAKGRPTKWFSVPELQKAGLAPTDASYAFSKGLLACHANWYERGHLAQKYLAERMGGKAGWYTHNVVNRSEERRVGKE